MNKRLIKIGTLLVALVFGTTAQATVVNGGFETGTLAGWTATVPTGATADVLTTFNSGFGIINPFAGNQMAPLEDRRTRQHRFDHPDCFYGCW